MPRIPAKVIEISKGIPQFEKQCEDMVQVLSKAFIADPLILPMLGASYETNPELYSEFFRAKLRLALNSSGRVFAALVNSDGADRLVGAAIWYGPGKQFLDGDGQLKEWKSFSDTLKPEIQNWWQEVLFPRHTQLTNEGLGEGVNKASLYLEMLGVHPEYQHKGIGTALVRYTLEQDDSCAVASSVETCDEKNLLFYNSLGYRVRSKILMPSPLGDFTMWCLYREPRI